ncbi:TIGR02710 family CRISPR-associated CARF protein [Mesobacillus jeotgali]|uniref:TIGR02710 family CRISPR-associated CARF protein n=1 Tax=Mesobacillus jeotgali TaxID=129985 RepID=UPI001CFCF79A|nr:TIGR02710 family CRISPR-associated CARF protein [Mesobacillus jeotgali]
MTFQEKLSEYLALQLKSRQEAKDYFFQDLLDDLCSNFTDKVNLNVAEGTLKKYEYLIMSVGFSPEPMILWIRAFNPKKVFFICSPNTEAMVDMIAEKTNLRPTQMKYYIVNSSDTLEVYEKIKRIKEEEKLEFTRENTAVDITGGKKSMVSGCTLAANMLGLDILYLDYSEYNPDMRKPKPGSEIPKKLDDPLEVFGDRELQRGITKFNSRNFLSAYEIFKEIEERVANPRLYEAYGELARAYKALEDMEFEEAVILLKKVIKYEKWIKNTIIPVDIVEEQLKVIEPLTKFDVREQRKVLGNPKMYWHLYGYYTSVAHSFIQQGKGDLAALLSYRCLEMSVQYMLFQKGIDPSRANFDDFDKEMLLNRVNQIGPELYGEHFYHYTNLPSKIGLMLGLMVLKALEDPIISKLKLAKILERTEARNKSRFAHGFNTLSVDEVRPFYFLVQNEVSNRLWELEKEELGYQKIAFSSFVRKFDFISL